MKHSLVYLAIGIGASSCGSSESSPDASGGSPGSPAGGTAGALINGGAGETLGSAGRAGAASAGAAGPGSGGSGSSVVARALRERALVECTVAGRTRVERTVAERALATRLRLRERAEAPRSSRPAGYKLVWHDEFDIDGPPNPADYNFEKGFQRNEEAQWYQSANTTVENGLLVIEARKETVPNPNYTGSGDWKTTRKTAEYTSSSLTTSGHQSFQYGHFEMRARIPTEAGMWPAWWTLGVSGQWPSNGEIDIMEFYQSKLLANVACGTATAWQAKWDSSTKSLSSLGANWASQFHVWTMDWDDQNIVLSVDGQQLNTTSLASMLNSDGKSPFKQKAYMLVNLAHRRPKWRRSRQDQLPQTLRGRLPARVPEAVRPQRQVRAGREHETGRTRPVRHHAAR